LHRTTVLLPRPSSGQNSWPQPAHFTTRASSLWAISARLVAAALPELILHPRLHDLAAGSFDQNGAKHRSQVRRYLASWGFRGLASGLGTQA